MARVFARLVQSAIVQAAVQVIATVVVDVGSFDHVVHHVSFVERVCEGSA